MSIETGEFDTAQFQSEEGAQQDSTEFGKATNEGLDHVSKPARKNVPGALVAVVPADPETVGADIPYVSNDGTLAYSESVRDVGARNFSARTVWTLPSSTAGFTGDPVLLAAEDESRARIIIRNVSAASDLPANAVFIGSLNDVQNGNGFILLAGKELTTEIQGALYAVLPAGAAISIPVSVWIETDS